LLEKLGDLRAARVLHAEALASDLKTYGAEHPKVARRRATLVRLLGNRVIDESVFFKPDLSSGMGYVHVERVGGDNLPADSVLIQLALAPATQDRRSRDVTLLAGESAWDADRDAAQDERSPKVTMPERWRWRAPVWGVLLTLLLAATIVFLVVR
jgi:hypothetical protein